MKHTTLNEAFILNIANVKITEDNFSGLLSLLAGRGSTEERLTELDPEEIIPYNVKVSVDISVTRLSSNVNLYLDVRILGGPLVETGCTSTTILDKYKIKTFEGLITLLQSDTAEFKKGLDLSDFLIATEIELKKNTFYRVRPDVLSKTLNLSLNPKYSAEKERYMSTIKNATDRVPLDLKTITVYTEKWISSAITSNENFLNSSIEAKRLEKKDLEYISYLKKIYDGELAVKPQIAPMIEINAFKRFDANKAREFMDKFYEDLPRFRIDDKIKPIEI